MAKDNRLYKSVAEFESFKKNPNETLKETYDRFCEVSNSCASLGRIYTMKDLNMRFLNSLGDLWHVKVAILKECRDLNTTHIQNIVSTLFLYEEELNRLGEVQK